MRRVYTIDGEEYLIVSPEGMWQDHMGMLTLNVISLEEKARQDFRDAGYDEIEPDVFVKTQGNTRIRMERVDGGWVSTIDLICGVRLIDPGDLDDYKDFLEPDDETGGQ